MPQNVTTKGHVWHVRQFDKIICTNIRMGHLRPFRYYVVLRLCSHGQVSEVGHKILLNECEAIKMLTNCFARAI